MGASIENRPADAESRAAWDVAATVSDPEIPVLTIEDLGVLRTVHADGSQVVATITPTYSGCPAMHAISDDVRTVLQEAGFADVEVRTVLAPAWTTDWMSDEGKRKLKEFGIAPPEGAAGGCPVARMRLVLRIQCPHCGSRNTREISRFGSTSCKALYECLACKEPFDYFKAH